MLGAMIHSEPASKRSTETKPTSNTTMDEKSSARHSVTLAYTDVAYTASGASSFDVPSAQMVNTTKKAVGTFGEAADIWEITFARTETLNQGLKAISSPLTEWVISLRIEWNGSIVFANDAITEDPDKSEDMPTRIERILSRSMDSLRTLNNSKFLSKEEKERHRLGELSKKNMSLVVQSTMSLYGEFEGLGRHAGMHQWTGILQEVQDNEQIEWSKVE